MNNIVCLVVFCVLFTLCLPSSVLAEGAEEKKEYQQQEVFQNKQSTETGEDIFKPPGGKEFRLWQDKKKRFGFALEVSLAEERLIFKVFIISK